MHMFSVGRMVYKINIFLHLTKHFVMNYMNGLKKIKATTTQTEISFFKFK